MSVPATPLTVIQLIERLQELVYLDENLGNYPVEFLDGDNFSHDVHKLELSYASRSLILKASYWGDAS